MSDDFDNDLSWLKNDDNDDSGDGDEHSSFDWQQSGEDGSEASGEDHLGVTGELSWIEDPTDEGQPNTRDDSLGVTGQLPWIEDDSDEASTGVTGQLNWTEGVHDRFEQQLEEAEAAAHQQAEDSLPDPSEISTKSVPSDDGGSMLDFPNTANSDGSEEVPIAGLPPWMADNDVDELVATGEPVVEDDIPEWMRDADPSDTNDSTPEEVIPDWMSNRDDFEAEPEARFENDEPPETLSVDPDLLPADAADDDDEFDLLGELTSDTTGQLLGGDDFDLLDKLTEGDNDFDPLGELSQGDTDFDLLDELTGGDLASDEFDTLADEAETADDFLAALDTSDVETLFEPAEPAPPVDDGLDSFFFDEVAPITVDEDFLTDLGASQDDLDMLADTGDADRLDAPVEADFLQDIALPQSGEAIDDVLASMPDSSLAVPDEQLFDLSGDVDFDKLFSNDSLDDLHDSAADADIFAVELSPDAPEWLRELSQADRTAFTAASALRDETDRPLDELPDRLRELRERGFELPSDSYTSGNTGMLADVLPGVHNTLPPVTYGDVSVAAGILTLTQSQSERAELLQTIAGRETKLDPETSMERQNRQVDSRLGAIFSSRFIISMILGVMMILPFLGVLKIGNLPSDQFAAASREEAFYHQIDQLQPGDLVLIAAEYGSTGSAELDEATETLLLHSLARGAHPVIVGGNPIGLLRADRIMSTIASANDFTPNQDYYTGQYLVGDVVGLRAFIENIGRLVRYNVRGKETGLDVDSLDDFAAIIVLAEQADRVRAWAEQVAPKTAAPLLAVTGYTAMPLSQPYLDANDLDIAGMLVGYEDSYTYRDLVNYNVLGVERPTSTSTITLLPTETFTSTVTDTPTPTRDPNDPNTDTPMPTNTPEPTDTPTKTSTDMPTVTPSNTSTSTPTPTSTPEPILFAVVTATSRVNVRNGPTTESSAIASMAPDERALIIGENEDGSWYNILMEDGTEGWIAEFLVEVIEVIPGQEPAESANIKPAKVDVLAKQQITATPIVPSTEEPDTEGMPTLDTSPLADRKVVSPEGDGFRNERWYSMTVGILMSVFIIAFGSIWNIVRGLRRRRESS